MIDTSKFAGRIFKLAGCHVKVRFGNGDDEPKDILLDSEGYIADFSDELCLFGYGEQGEEYYIATIHQDTGKIFDVAISGEFAHVLDVCSLADLEPVDDSWIDEVLKK